MRIRERFFEITAEQFWNEQLTPEDAAALHPFVKMLADGMASEGMASGILAVGSSTYREYNMSPRVHLIGENIEQFMKRELPREIFKLLTESPQAADTYWGFVKQVKETFGDSVADLPDQYRDIDLFVAPAEQGILREQVDVTIQKVLEQSNVQWVRERKRKADDLQYRLALCMGLTDHEPVHYSDMSLTACLPNNTTVDIFTGTFEPALTLDRKLEHERGTAEYSRPGPFALLYTPGD
jgi:hypothetical protein